MLGEAQVRHVGGGIGDEPVGDRIACVGVGGGHCSDRVAESESVGDDHFDAVIGERFEVRLPVVGGRCLEFDDCYAELCLGLIGTAPCGVVERAVAATAGVECQADANSVAAVAAAVVVIAAAGREDQCSCETGCE